MDLQSAANFQSRCAGIVDKSLVILEQQAVHCEMDLPHVQVNQLANHRFQPQHLPVPRYEQFRRDPLTTSLDLQLTIKRPLSQIHSSEDQMAQVPIESWCQEIGR